jgi:hypothetical protein
MKTFMSETKTAKTNPTGQKYDTLHPKQASASSPAHSDIARRAYEIYLKNGRRQGQAEKNWHQAEQELRNEKVESIIQR